MMKKGATFILLDPAAAYAREVALRDDCTFVVTHPCHPAIFYEQDTPEARADMFGGVHDYLMPCEATIPWWIDMVRWSQERQGPPPDLEGRVAGLVNAWRPSFSSLWGPVPHPGRRDVPEHDAAVEMAARRLGPGWGTLVEGVTP